MSYEVHPHVFAKKGREYVLGYLMGGKLCPVTNIHVSHTIKNTRMTVMWMDQKGYTHALPVKDPVITVGRGGEYIVNTKNTGSSLIFWEGSPLYICTGCEVCSN